MAKKATKTRPAERAQRKRKPVTVYFSSMRGGWPGQTKREQERYPVIFAAWFSRAPTREPFRPPDDAGTAVGREYVGGIVASFVQTFHDRDVELVELPAEWVRAWRRMHDGKPPWPGATKAGNTRPPRTRTGARAPRPKRAPARGGRPARPDWAERLGLTLPCTADDIARAFRKRAFECHPDRGGSTTEFVALTQAREAAIRHVGA